jgi:hypothetical protein
MPALVNPDKVIAADAAESTFKQCITVVEKKVRNLEKRKVRNYFSVRCSCCCV